METLFSSQKKSSPPRVFISYSHEEPQHNKKVIDLAADLRKKGVDAWIDRYESHPSEGWPRWMTRQIEIADFVLCVCTEIYCRRFEGKEEKGGKGVTWEGMLAGQVLYEAGSSNAKFIPLQFDRNVRFIPLVLRPYTCYLVPDHFSELCRHVTGQPEIDVPAIGKNRPGWSLEMISVCYEGAPEPLPEYSPFSPGPAITISEAFFGRKRELAEVEDAIRIVQPIQILGETRMGKTSMLNRIADDLTPDDRPVVRVNAQDVTGASPASLVAEIANQMGRKTYFNECLAITEGISEEVRVLSVLRDLVPFTLILDEADLLVKPGHKFTDRFLNQCRSLCQDKGMLWISASRVDLQNAFQQTDLASDFLNDSRRIVIGHLDRQAVEALLAPLEREVAKMIFKQADGFAYGLQWLGDAWWRRPDAGEQVLADEFALAMVPTFRRWWNHCDEQKQMQLKEALKCVSEGDYSVTQRRNLRLLVQQGLAVEECGVFSIPGIAWQEYVSDRIK